jgi:Rieske Fe-S protein
VIEETTMSSESDDAKERGTAGAVPERAAPESVSRRTVSLGVVAAGCALAAGVGLPAVATVAAPLGVERGGGLWVRTVGRDQLRDGEPTRVAVVADRRDAWTLEKGVELGSVWLVRRGERVDAFSAVCPHLGCSVNALPDGSFACPCHTSAFDPSGKRRSGPAPRDLDSLATRIEDGVVAVDFRRFRIGVAEKVET